MPGCNSKSPVGTPAPSLKERSFNHCGESACPTNCACARATLEVSSAATTAAADDARRLVVIGVGKGTRSAVQLPQNEGAASRRSNEGKGAAFGSTARAGDAGRRGVDRHRILVWVDAGVRGRDVRIDGLDDLGLSDEGELFADALVGLGG